VAGELIELDRARRPDLPILLESVIEEINTEASKALSQGCAAEVLNAMVGLSDKHPEQAQTAYHAAVALSWTGRHEESLPYFDRAIAADRNFFYAYSGKAACNPASLLNLVNAQPPRPRIEAIRIVDMSSSNSWAEFAALFRNTRQAFLDHERAKSELKSLMPEDAKEAIGYGVRARRSRSGAVSFDVLESEGSHAPVQRIGGRPCFRLGQGRSRADQSEKSLTATIRSGRAGEAERTFRYAPLSSGLDIVRKTLGQHEIATIQTTAIDRWHRQFDHDAGARLGRVDRLGLAGLSPCRDCQSPAHGRRLRPPLCPLHARWHRWRGRSFTKIRRIQIGHQPRRQRRLPGPTRHTELKRPARKF
jgi:hypothetical protein